MAELPSRNMFLMSSEAAESQVHLRILKNRAGEWKSGFFTVDKP